ncbi:glycosyltransferase family 2 protein [Kushneria indalinina]|uniref:Glycosyltransferase involved in cell wall biosynthesis n=1 Tax=Kushneria indalinina DSM 14324 TaxID=1122140 RepID=A0A3D9DYF0_9GAMM|nr:glycosyltransferase [Kushneria indalinina]REC95695.1 glycosyltransferase involved in cell wall biosynthesis [Kushneria indalinina DSM 14324]
MPARPTEAPSADAPFNDALPTDALPTQEALVRHWPSDADRPEVSVICTTFNQAGYIRETIEGFLRQQTDFCFEIIVHDDASTDGTADIVAEYAARYPRVIRAVLRDENQYQKGHRIMPLAAGFARGAYLALCEGDDFWCDEQKLARQYRAMQARPEIAISYHNVIRRGPEQESLHIDVQDSRNHERVVALDELLVHTGDYCPSPSLMLHRSVVERLPEWFYTTAPVGDFYLQVLAAWPAGALYLPDVMAVYRTQAQGSWSQQQRQLEDDRRYARHQDFMARHAECMHHLATMLDASHTPSITLAMARRWYYASVEYLQAGRYRGFRDAIAASMHQQAISAPQRLLFLLRRTPRLAGRLIAMRHQYQRRRRSTDCA